MEFKKPGDFLALGGEMGDLIRTHDWARSAVGAIESWPRTLKGYTAMILQLPSPAIIFWGAEQTQIYNAGYAKIMGPRHPQYLGSSYRECWPDTYPVIYPWMERVLRDAEVIEVEREHFSLTRHGFDEEAYFTFSFSPLLGDDGVVAGFIQPVVEVTDAVLGDRRLATLRAVSSVEGRQADALSAVVEALRANPRDVPFAQIWLAPGGQGALEPAAGVGLDGAPLEGEALGRLVSEASSKDEGAVVDDVRALLGRPQVGVWGTPTRSAFVTPLRARDGRPVGVALLGISPRLRFDDKYRAFFESIAHDFSAALANEHEEYAHAETRKLLTAIVDNQPELAWTARPGGYVDFFNRRWYEHTGKSFAELRGDGWQALIAPEHRATVVARWRECVAGGSPFEMEFPIRRKDGDGRWFLTRIAPLRTSDGAIDRWFATSADIHELLETRANTEALLAQVRSQAADMEGAILRMREEKERAEAALRAR